ncbi:MAG: hypothetical protein QG608_2980 [Actinomycetota bacterium]|nr:hypothetical protein [Actinomycetota bacterium]
MQSLFSSEGIAVFGRSILPMTLGILLVTGCSGVKGDQDDVTASPAANEGSMSPSAVGRAGAEAVSQGSRFVDPQGGYSIYIGKTWAPMLAARSKDAMMWSLDSSDGGAVPGVNVFSEETDGKDLDDYLQLSAKNMTALKLRKRETVRTADGGVLGVLEYSGSLTGRKNDREYHFLGVVDVVGERAVVATLAAYEEDFADLRARTEPYLLTLKGS